jgi:hypothetical protein
MTRAAAHLALVLALVTGLAGAPAQADEATTRCTFQGATPGFRAMVVELERPSDFLLLQLHGQRRSRLVNDDQGWHLAEGIAVIDAATREIVAHQLRYSGTVAPAVVAEVDGETAVRAGAVAPEGPWTHTTRDVPPRLAAGTYWVVAFGTGGSSAGALPQQWSATVSLRGSHSCQATAPGRTFDYDQRHFTGGTQVYAAGAGTAEGTSLAVDLDRPLVFGLMSARSQVSAASTSSLDYTLPGEDAGRLDGAMRPFVSSAGTHAFHAAYRGVHPIVAVTGAALELPRRQEQP